MTEPLLRTLLGPKHDCADIGKTQLFPYAQEVLLKFATVVSASMSVCGALFIIVGFVVHKELRRVTVYRLVLPLSVADLFASITFILDASRPIVNDGTCPDALCYVLASCTQFFGLASLLWTAAICHSVYSILRKAIRTGYIDSSSRGFLVYHAVCWLVPLLTVAIILVTGSVGGTGQQCWIHDKHQGYRFVFFFLPLVAVEAFNLGVYRIVSRAMNQTLFRDTVFNRIRRYLLVSLVCKGLSLINRSYSYFARDRPLFILYLISSIGTPLQGAGNALVFGDQRLLRSLCRRVCGAPRSWLLGGPAYERTHDHEAVTPRSGMDVEMARVGSQGGEGEDMMGAVGERDDGTLTLKDKEAV